MSGLLRLVNRKSVLFVAVLFSALLTAFMIKYWSFILANAAIFLALIPIFIGLATFSIKYPYIYFRIIYIKALMFGVDTLWNFSAKYSGTISTNNFKRLCSALEKISNNVSVYMETEKMYKGTLDGINVSLNIDSIDNDDLLDENDYRQCIHFQIRDFRAQYENTIKILEADIVPYLSKINSIIKPEKSDFELTIKFFNGNPWAKAVTKGIKYDDILNMNFTVRVEDDKKAQGKVDIGKKDLRVTCNELHVLSQLIKRRLMVSM